jgi:UDP-GlcNAc:undecaprenyl-phosphate GlcNAc-1-phosphate transferase
MVGYGVVLLVAALTTWALTPVVRRFAVGIGAVVRPDPRRVHTVPTPTLGGAAMFVGFLVAMAVASRIPQFKAVFHGTSEPLGVVLAAGAMFVVGALHDTRDVSPPAKLAGQVFAASILSLLGVEMFYFRIPLADFVVLSPDLAPLITVIWVAGMANAINLIDGLDGLAAGIVAIAGSGFFLYSDRLFKAGFLPGNNIGPLIACIAVGVCLGFLPHNFHPAKIFMGDAGALFLGLLMASSTIVVGGRESDQFSGQTFFFYAPLLIPIFILGVPILDTAFAIARRAVRRTSPAVADKDHLHHRLMRLGHGQRRAVVILWAWTAVLSGLILAPIYTKQGQVVVPFGIAALALGLYVVFHPGARRAREASSHPSAPGEDAGDAAAVVELDARRANH